MLLHGADTHSIDKLKRNFNLEDLPLDICYRCPENVVRLAKTIVPAITWNTAREDKGNVELLEYNEFYKKLQPDDIVLARKNKDLLSIYRNLVLDRKISVKFKNTELVNSLVKEVTHICKDYITKYNKNLNIERNLYKYLKDNHIPSDKKLRSAQQQALFEQRYKDLIDYAKQDKSKSIIKSNYTIDYLTICIKEFKEKGAYKYEPENSLTEYCDLIESFIKDFREKENTILFKNFLNYLKAFLSGNLYEHVPILSSVHSMKGGEADNIFIFDYPKFPYEFNGQSDEMKQQEVNLKYVALTRAKKNLYLCLTNDPPADKKEDDINLKATEEVKRALAEKY